MAAIVSTPLIDNHHHHQAMTIGERIQRLNIRWIDESRIRVMLKGDHEGHVYYVSDDADESLYERLAHVTDLNVYAVDTKLIDFTKFPLLKRVTLTGYDKLERFEHDSVTSLTLRSVWDIGLVSCENLETLCFPPACTNYGTFKGRITIDDIKCPRLKNCFSHYMIALRKRVKFDNVERMSYPMFRQLHCSGDGRMYGGAEFEMKSVKEIYVATIERGLENHISVHFRPRALRGPDANLKRVTGLKVDDQLVETLAVTCNVREELDALRYPNLETIIIYAADTPHDLDFSRYEKLRKIVFWNSHSHVSTKYPPSLEKIVRLKPKETWFRRPRDDVEIETYEDFELVPAEYRLTPFSD